MLLTITTTHTPATDLGYLLGKHPARIQNFELAFGRAHVFYPEATETRCTVALLLEIDPVELVRGRKDFTLEQYVNDRPYTASSFLSVAISQVYGSALGGRSRERAELAETELPLEAKISVLPSRGGEKLLRHLFEPLGYTLTVQRYLLDETFQDWGYSPYYTVTLAATKRLSDLLSHLYVLIPVLDDDKHYYVGDDEIEKLLRHGKTWLAAHPARDLITARYLKHQHSLKREALSRLTDAQPDAEEVKNVQDAEEVEIERPLSLHQQRLDAVLNTIKASGAARIIDLGCGEGKLLSLLAKEMQFTAITGMDVSHRVLQTAAERLEHIPKYQHERITLLHGSLMYRDARLSGFDAAAVVEVIEHLDPPRLSAFERVVFEFARPKMVIITTPNIEYNVKWTSLPAGKFRHKDHRFEWTRAEFRTWAEKVAAQHGYQVEFLPIGPEDAEVGAPSQMGVFNVNVTTEPG